MRGRRDAPRPSLTATLARLFLIQFFSWSGMFALWIYAVPVITRALFAASAADSAGYRTGLLWVSAGFAGYALLSACLAFGLPRLVALAGYRLVHGTALLIGGAGIASIAFARQPLDLVPAFIAIGIGWSSIGNLPYTIVGLVAPPDRIGHTMRLFGFSTVVPQAVATFALAWASSALFASALERILIVGGASMALAGLLALLLLNAGYVCAGQPDS